MRDPTSELLDIRRSQNDQDFANDDRQPQDDASRSERHLNDGLADSFPASDPVAVTQPRGAASGEPQPDAAIVLPPEEARQSERNIWNGTSRLILGGGLVLAVIAAVVLWTFFK